MDGGGSHGHGGFNAGRGGCHQGQGGFNGGNGAGFNANGGFPGAFGGAGGASFPHGGAPFQGVSGPTFPGGAGGVSFPGGAGKEEEMDDTHKKHKSGGSSSKYPEIHPGGKNSEASDEGHMQEDVDFDEDDLLDDVLEVCENGKNNGDCPTQVVNSPLVDVVIEPMHAVHEEMLHASSAFSKGIDAAGGGDTLTESVLDSSMVVLVGHQGNQAPVSLEKMDVSDGGISSVTEVETGHGGGGMIVGGSTNDGFCAGGLAVAGGMAADRTKSAMEPGLVLVSGGFQDGIKEAAMSLDGVVNDALAVTPHLRRSKRRASTTDEDSVERASRLVAIKNLEVDKVR
nr:unnamed protein product [Digitaria exilis]